ncbi:UDP-glycosyltransferase 74E2-like [Momordica charantia]|uniref:Glycosyltransferase n=1 Tax=Momordica charantia TaxID=3673 RepID=A0A6J1BRK9_MOMCH|nr:UDP-glycosyltransferase 74E2-like [Momordica charantia]
MEKATANGGRRSSHVLLFAYPMHGHMSPMLQFAKRLASKGLLVTFLTTSSVTESLQIDLPPSYPIHLRFISDFHTEVIETLKQRHEAFAAAVSRSLGEFLDGALINGDHPPRLMVFDSVMPWAMEVARSRGLEAAPFFTESAAVNHILNQVYEGSLSIPAPENAAVSIPSLPNLEAEDLPYFPSVIREVTLEFMTRQFSSFKDAKWIFINTFDQLEPQIVNWMGERWPIKTVGPTVPSAYLDGRLEKDKTYGLKRQKPEDGRAVEWLDSKETASVVYISFGSLVMLAEKQVKELTNFLTESGLPFLWVLRESEMEKLPENFIQETSGKGLVVNWCSQLEVLSHKAVGCFVTHGGWNSTLEALSSGVPMVAVPQWIDQTTNAKFIADVWEIGVRVKLNEKHEIATKDELEASIRQVIEGREKKNSIKWRKLAKEAVDEGGSSDKNIEDFAKTIMLLSN